MSLIHQKLYTGDDASAVDMAVYLPELIRHLSQCYDMQNKIQFTHDISSLKLGGSLAVPVGLIVNEAVTNSIKYAFVNTTHPRVHIRFQREEGSLVRLQIADNGIGISERALADRTNSLGLTLIQGLSQDIGGQLFITNKGGTTISVVFDGWKENVMLSADSNEVVAH